MTITKDSSAPLVVIVGATGNQGSAVVAGLAGSSKPYRVRGFTRDPSKPAGQKLAQQGVEVVALSIELTNAAAVQQAFRGADVAFIMTTFWEHFSKQQEIDEGKMLIDAAYAAGVKRIIWSSFHSIEVASGGKYTKADHFESKYQVTEWARKKFAGTDVAFINAYPAGYYQMFTSFNPIMMRRDGTDKIALVLPMSPNFGLGAIDIRDFGKFVVVAIEDPAYARGGDILAATEFITAEGVVRELSAATGKTFVFERATNEEYKAFVMANGMPERIANDLVDTFTGEEEYLTPSRPAFAKIAAPLTSFKDFIAGQDLSAPFA
ncbi:NAD(P)-binding protein [Auriculariales sp. MPI-PUGE-AT-0066]|nr:NAD(P)-binding protein [Auriculariales sp. MPI-PUGE-AT-0066]